MSPAISDDSIRDVLEILVVFFFLICYLFLRKVVNRYLSAQRTEQFPELGLLEPQQADQVWEEAGKSAGLWGWEALLFAAGFVLYFAGGLMLRFGLGADTEFKRDILKISLLAAILLGGPFVRLVVLRGKITKAIRIEISKLGVPVCLKCGYSLQGMTEPRCNECGAEYRADLCWTCLGKGCVSRVNNLLLGMAFFGGWAALNGILLWASGDWRKIQALMAFTSPLAIVGVMILVWYSIGGRKMYCLVCGGTGVRREAGAGPENVSQGSTHDHKG